MMISDKIVDLSSLEVPQGWKAEIIDMVGEKRFKPTVVPTSAASTERQKEQDDDKQGGTPASSSGDVPSGVNDTQPIVDADGQNIPKFANWAWSKLMNGNIRMLLEACSIHLFFAFLTLKRRKRMVRSS